LRRAPDEAVLGSPINGPIIGSFTLKKLDSKMTILKNIPKLINPQLLYALARSELSSLRNV